MCKKLVYLIISFIVLTFTTDVVQADLAGWEEVISEADPLHWYKFDDTGSECIDSGSGGLNGTYNGVLLGAEGTFGPGTAAQFTRASGNVVDFANATDLDGPYTVEYIVKTFLPGPVSQVPQALHDSAVAGLRLAGWSAMSEIGFVLYGVADYRFTPETDFTLNDLVAPQDVWIHLTFRNNGSGTQVFIDGVLMGTQANMVPLGRLRIGSHGATTNALDGVLDEAVVFNRALTNAEIFEHATKTFPLKATNPSPEDGAIYTDTWVSLTWVAGSTAASHDVYLSDNFDDVNDGTGDAFRGNQATTNFVAGFPGFPYPEGLVPGTTYHWRIDEVEADGVTKHKGDIWSFTVPTKTGYDPIPADGAEYIALDTTLSWTGGFGAKLHTVYFGDNFDDVNNAIGGLPGTETTYNPGPLEKDMTYYWRVDEFDGAMTHKGDVWSFSTIITIPISDQNLVGWWTFDEGAGDLALDWSGHDNTGDLADGPQWVTGQFGSALAFDNSRVTIPASDSLTADLFQGPFTLVAWINPTRAGNTWQQIFRAIKTDNTSNDTLFINNDGRLSWRGRVSTAWTVLCETAPDVVPVNQWTHFAVVGDETNFSIYVNGAPTQESDFQITDGTNANYYIGGNPGAAGESYAGMVDDARVYNKVLSDEEITKAMRGDPQIAWGPSPANGSTPDLDMATPLTWSPGDNASQHDVYFGLDADAVSNADASDTTGIYRGRQSGTSYTPPEGVEWGGGPYYWRIDEVNTDGTISKGRLWSFSVAGFVLVDDFEGYTDNDLANEAIWQHWIDGFGIPSNGAQVGYLLPPYAERTIVHSGNQSMPFLYDNTGGVANSEAVLMLTAPRDWTRHDVAELSLWFRGYPPSVGSFTEGPVGTYTMTGSGADIWAAADQFHYVFKSLTGAGTISVQVRSVQNTSGWAKAGVMIRETLDPGSKHALACVTPANGVAFQGRLDTDGASFNTNQTGLTAPYWVRVERDVSGNFSVAHSANGTTWGPVQGSAPRNISMTSNVYIGLALCSTNAAQTCQAVFSNVTTTGNVSGQWTGRDIGIASNAAEPMYVAISNSTGAPAVVAHDDPAAATIDIWTEWPIPLQAFADQGINLSDVDSIAIGLGANSGLTSAGGSGTVYFDDIRLLRAEP